MSAKRTLIFVIVIYAALLAGCSSSTTAQEPIAYYPKVTPIAQYPPPYTLVYHAYLELKVSNVDRAAEKATQMAYDYGGYLASSQSWYVDGRKVTSLELAVPNVNFDRLRRALYSLGNLVSESVSGEMLPTYPGDSRTLFSTITLQLRPSQPSLPNIKFGGWDPGRTLQNAFSVFLTIFGFLADIAIWIVVVAGPFVIIAIIVRLVMRRMRRNP